MLRERHQRLSSSGTVQNSELSGKCRKLRQAMVWSRLSWLEKRV